MNATKTTTGKELIGTVVKAAMKDTATVKVDRYVKNAKYKKYFVRSKKYLAHDLATDLPCPKDRCAGDNLVRFPFVVYRAHLFSLAHTPNCISADRGNRTPRLQFGRLRLCH